MVIDAWVLWLAGFAAFGVCVWRLALWADDRGWIAVRKEHRIKPLGVGMMHIASIYEPGIEHVIDEVFSIQTRADQDESGEGDVTDPAVDDLSAPRSPPGD